MVPLRHWKPQQGLERPVNAGHREQILTTAHMGDALGRIIHHHGNMVAGRTILAAQNHVPQFLRAADLVSGPHVPPQQGSRNPRRGAAVQPPRKGLAGFEKLLPAPLVKQAAGSRINVHAAALRRAAPWRPPPPQSPGACRNRGTAPRGPSTPGGHVHKR